MSLYKCDSVKDLESWKLSWVIRWALDAIICVIRGSKKETWHRQEKATRRWWRNGEVTREEMPAMPINFQIAELKKTLMSPLDSKEIKPANPKGNQHWIFIGRTDAEAEAPILLPPDAKSRLTGKDPDAGKDGGQEEKRATGDEMIEWHHRLNGHESEQTPGDREGQRSLVCCSPWGRKESDTAEQLNNNSPKPEEARNKFSPTTSRESIDLLTPWFWSRDTNFGLPASRMVEEQSSVILSLCSLL